MQSEGDGGSSFGDMASVGDYASMASLDEDGNESGPLDQSKSKADQDSEEEVG